MTNKTTKCIEAEILRSNLCYFLHVFADEIYNHHTDFLKKDILHKRIEDFFGKPFEAIPAPKNTKLSTKNWENGIKKLQAKKGKDGVIPYTSLSHKKK